MNVEELEVKIKEGREALVKLEDTYEKEEDANKLMKLEYRISRKEEQINRHIDRQNELLDKEALDGMNDNDKNAEEKEDKKDEDLCPECGGDLVLVGKDGTGETDIYECEKCKELFLDE